MYLLGPDVGSGFRFRAPVTKVLPEKPEAHQTTMWGREVFVEVWTTTEDKARALANDHFPGKHGYTVGAFVRTGDDEVVGQAA